MVQCIVIGSIGLETTLVQASCISPRPPPTPEAFSFSPVEIHEVLKVNFAERKPAFKKVDCREVSIGRRLHYSFPNANAAI